MSVERPAILGGRPVNPAGPPGWPVADPAVNEAVAVAMADGSWGRYLGPHGARLRAALAAFHDARHVHLCASGTAAVDLALRGLGVGPGDEVILAAYDFEANFKNVLAIGARPVLVDVRHDDGQIDVERIAQAGSEWTKTLLVSHLHGGVVDMPRLREIAEERRWSILEDACQMPGAMIFGRRAGMWGDAGLLSFGGSKLLTAGRGGCLFTNRDDVQQRIRLHSWRGNDLSPLSELQCAALAPQLEQLDERNQTRAASVQRLRELLSDEAGLQMFPERSPTASFGHSDLEHASDLELRASKFPTRPGYYKVAFWYDPAAFHVLPRDLFAAAMRAEGIALWPGFRGLHRTHSRRRYRTPGELPNADAADERLLVLHHPVLLGTPVQIEQFAAAVRKVRRFADEIRDTVTADAYDSFEDAMAALQNGGSAKEPDA